MKITRITLNNFLAFKYECSVDIPKGKNLLLYGENGSGKSSLYEALRLCLEPATAIEKHRNVFVSTDDSYVKLEIGDGKNPSDKLEWDETSHPYTEEVIVEACKTKGFLDYRALLKTHFVHRDTDSVNVFALLVDTLLTGVENPVNQMALGNQWRQIRSNATGRRSRARTQALQTLTSDFNTGVVVLLADLTTKSNEILSQFEQDVDISLTLAPPGLSYDAITKRVTGEVISLAATYYGKPIADHHHFLNEARLSAIAISLYLGALLLNPRSRLRLLFLDDVLIGLDTSNRLPLLHILERHFADWQIILATFDKVWFDMAWQRVRDLRTWEQGELWRTRDNECDVPIYKGNTDYLNVARKHLDTGDLRAAAIYIRASYERELKHFCDKHRLPLPYFENRKKQRAEDFWQVVRTQRRSDGSALLDAQLVADVEFFRSTILNQLSHTAPINLARVEVEKAHLTVSALRDTLR